MRWRSFQKDRFLNGVVLKSGERFLLFVYFFFLLIGRYRKMKMKAF